jgi:hypothetical protein
VGDEIMKITHDVIGIDGTVTTEEIEVDPNFFDPPSATKTPTADEQNTMALNSTISSLSATVSYLLNKVGTA